jgi:hypothetical protein
MKLEDRELEASLKEHIERRNYAAAASVAERLEEPVERVRELQEAAVKRNARGAIALVQEFRFTEDEIDHLFEAIVKEAGGSGEKSPSWTGRSYDVKTMKYLNIEEWIAHYGKELKQAGSP